MSVLLPFSHETMSAATLLFMVFRKQSPQSFWMFLREAIMGSLTIHHKSEEEECHDAWCQQESVDQIALGGCDFVSSQQVLIHWSLAHACGAFLYIYIAQHWDLYTLIQHSIVKVVRWFRSGNSYRISQCRLMIFPCGSWSSWLLPSLPFVNNFHCLIFFFFCALQPQLFCGRPVSHTHTDCLSLLSHLLPSSVLVRGPSGQLQHVAERNIWPFVIGNLLGNWFLMQN